MVGKIIMEGILLGALLVLFCAVGIRKGAVTMVFLYHTRGRTFRPSTTFRSPSVPGRPWPWWAPPAAARPRCAA